MFNVRKATQVAAYLIWKRGGTMSYLKLMKLMYLAEKDSLLRNEEFLTGSKLVSMPRGPVLSSVYDLFFRRQRILGSMDLQLRALQPFPVCT